MRKLYGDSLRKDAGFVKVIKSVASKNARLFESRAGRHAPEIKRVAKEVKGTFDKVFEETADVVEEFLARCKCEVIRRGVTRHLRFRCSETQDIGGDAGDQGSSAAITGKTSYHVSMKFSVLTVL
jgi:hypothetical protein